MASDLLFKSGNAVHRALISLTRGRLGWRAGGMPVLKLTTIGRVSGLPRTVILTSPHQNGDAMVLVASRWGTDRDPDWFLNLTANPVVEVEIEGRPPRRMVARVAESDERAELWKAAVAKYPNYGNYQQKTERLIPVVVLEPQS